MPAIDFEVGACGIKDELASSESHRARKITLFISIKTNSQSNGKTDSSRKLELVFSA